MTSTLFSFVLTSLLVFGWVSASHAQPVSCAALDSEEVSIDTHLAFTQASKCKSGEWDELRKRLKNELRVEEPAGRGYRWSHLHKLVLRRALMQATGDDRVRVLLALADFTRPGVGGACAHVPAEQCRTGDAVEHARWKRLAAQESAKLAFPKLTEEPRQMKTCESASGSDRPAVILQPAAGVGVFVSTIHICLHAGQGKAEAVSVGASRQSGGEAAPVNHFSGGDVTPDSRAVDALMDDRPNPTLPRASKMSFGPFTGPYLPELCDGIPVTRTALRDENGDGVEDVWTVFSRVRCTGEGGARGVSRLVVVDGKTGAIFFEGDVRAFGDIRFRIESDRPGQFSLVAPKGDDDAVGEARKHAPRLATPGTYVFQNGGFRLESAGSN